MLNRDFVVTAREAAVSAAVYGTELWSTLSYLCDFRTAIPLMCEQTAPLTEVVARTRSCITDELIEAIELVAATDFRIRAPAKGAGHTTFHAMALAQLVSAVDAVLDFLKYRAPAYLGKPLALSHYDVLLPFEVREHRSKFWAKWYAHARTYGNLTDATLANFSTAYDPLFTLIEVEEVIRNIRVESAAVLVALRSREPGAEVPNTERQEIEAAREWLRLRPREGGPSGPQHLLVSLLVEADGWMSHENLSIRGGAVFSWSEPTKNAKIMVARIETKLRKLSASWKIEAEVRKGCEIALRVQDGS